MHGSKRSGARWKWPLALVLLGTGWGIAGFWNGGASTPPAFTTSAVERGALQETVSASGQVNPVVNAGVGSQVSGIIDEILVDFNSEVRQGQVLARLDTSTFEANVRQAEAELAAAEADLALAEVEVQRLRSLRERDIEVDNPGGRLKPGMTATVAIITAEKEDVLRVRNAALRARLPEQALPSVVGQFRRGRC